MIFKGFKFGMLLQFAIGPVCLFIFQTGTSKGFYIAETGVFGVVLVDALYIFSAILGIASIINKKNIKLGLNIFGAAILFVFGLSTVLAQFNISFLPSLSLQNSAGSNSAFLRALLMTISNPMTILFWAGVFSAKLTDEKLNRSEMYRYGLGAVLSTLFFLSLVAMLGSLTRTLLPHIIIQGLNLLVGLVLIGFGFSRLLFKKQ